MEFQDTTPAAALALESESRRRFVAQTGLVAAAAAVGGTGLAMASAPPLPTMASGRTLRVGMLLPQGRAYPLLGTQVLEGAQTFAEQTGHGQLHITPVFYGGYATQAERAARELLAGGKVDVLAGFVDPDAAASWAPLLAEHQIPLLVGDTGANALNPQVRSPWIVHNSLGYWQATWAAGRWAAKALGPRAVVAVGPADSGFDHLPAFERGFASAGGRVLATVFTRAPDGTSKLEALARLVRQTRPDLVFALDSGPRSAEFRQFWARSGIADHVPLVVGGMLAESMAGARQALAGTRIWAVRPWLPDVASTQGVNQSTPFQLLGYELAQRLQAATLPVQRGAAQGLELALTMASMVLRTPRGEVHMDQDSGETVAPTYLQGLHQDAPSQSVLPKRPAAACQDLCKSMTSRVMGAYLAA